MRLADILLGVCAAGVACTFSAAITIACSQTWINEPNPTAIRVYASILTSATFVFLFSIICSLLWRMSWMRDDSDLRTTVLTNPWWAARLTVSVGTFVGPILAIELSLVPLASITHPALFPVFLALQCLLGIPAFVSSVRVMCGGEEDWIQAVKSVRPRSVADVENVATRAPSSASFASSTTACSDAEILDQRLSQISNALAALFMDVLTALPAKSVAPPAAATWEDLLPKTPNEAHISKRSSSETLDSSMSDAGNAASKVEPEHLRTISNWDEKMNEHTSLEITTAPSFTITGPVDELLAALDGGLNHRPVEVDVKTTEASSHNQGDVDGVPNWTPPDRDSTFAPLVSASALHDWGSTWTQKGTFDGSDRLAITDHRSTINAPLTDRRESESIRSESSSALRRRKPARPRSLGPTPKSENSEDRMNGSGDSVSKETEGQWGMSLRRRTKSLTQSRFRTKVR